MVQPGYVGCKYCEPPHLQHPATDIFTSQLIFAQIPGSFVSQTYVYLNMANIISPVVSTPSDLFNVQPKGYTHTAALATTAELYRPV